MKKLLLASLLCAITQLVCATDVRMFEGDCLITTNRGDMLRITPDYLRVREITNIIEYSTYDAETVITIKLGTSYGNRIVTVSTGDESPCNPEYCSSGDDYSDRSDGE